MRDAQHLRAQAELCLEIARHLADRASAEEMRAEASRYQQEAAELEVAEGREPAAG